MASRKCRCPKCNRSLTVVQALPAQVKCPKSDTRFEIAPDGTTKLAAPRPAEKVAVAAGVQPPPTMATSSESPWWQSDATQEGTPTEAMAPSTPVQPAPSLPPKSP